MLDVANLYFDYQEHPVLAQISLHLPAGGLMHLKGANGVGKTTLLKLIAGLYRPLRGSIQFCGHNIIDDMPAYQRQLCFIGHKTGINPGLSVRENCTFDAHYHGQDLEALAMVFKLEPYLDSPCAHLSAGQRRQVGLLRLWMSRAKLWLLDEPLVALDDNALDLVMAQIAAHRKEGGAVLLTSHQALPIDSVGYVEYCL